MIWRSIQYDFPGVAWLLFVTGLILWSWYALYLYREDKLKMFTNAALLPGLMKARLPAIFWLKTFLFCMLWICGVLALMEPKGNERYIHNPAQKDLSSDIGGKVRKKMHEVIMLIDASASMRVADAYAGKTRLDVAKQIADDVVSELRGENISLFAFTSATMQLVPSTNDYLFARLMLRQLEINEGETAGTNIKQALETVRKSYFNKISAKPKTLILFSDGGDTTYENLQRDAQNKALAAILKPIEDANEQHLHVMVVGLGSNEGKDVPEVTYQGKAVHSGLDSFLLKKLSVVGQGQFLQANEMTPLQVAQTLSKVIAQSNYYEDIQKEQVADENEEKIFDLYYQIPLGIAILALAFILILPDTFISHPKKNERIFS